MTAPLDRNPLAAEVAHLARRLLAHPHEPVDAPYPYARLTEWGHDVVRLSDRLRRSAGTNSLPTAPRAGHLTTASRAFAQRGL